MLELVNARAPLSCQVHLDTEHDHLDPLALVCIGVDSHYICGSWQYVVDEEFESAGLGRYSLLIILLVLVAIEVLTLLQIVVVVLHEVDVLERRLFLLHCA